MVKRKLYYSSYSENSYEEPLIIKSISDLIKDWIRKR